ncbi:MAG: hypothetical protein KDD89_09935 [Anaerolineales bacterium]|nr:hypothetical protein [Anaerolineales bacterium]
MSSFAFSVLILFVFIFAFIAFSSPFEALEWWAGWQETPTAVGDHAIPTTTDRPAPSHNLVYLTGIGGFSRDFLPQRERNFVNALKERYPNAIIVDDVFPYSATNNPLDGHRVSAWLWAKLHRQSKENNLLAVLLINMRNMLQYTVSADRRYGPVYNAGVAEAVAWGLVRRGYVPDGRPIYLIGYSGGGQISVAISRYLEEVFQVPIYIISIGGVMSDDPGFKTVAHVYHLRGQTDLVPLVGYVWYPSRWPLFFNSNWNQFKRSGRLTHIDMGKIQHTGSGGYFTTSRQVPDGRTYLQKTTDVVADIIESGQVAA